MLRCALLASGFVLHPHLAAAEQQAPASSRHKPAVVEPSPGDSAPSPDLGSEAALSRNISLYESGRYGECVRELEATLTTNLVKKTLRPEQVEQAQTYLAACLIADGKPAEADRVFGEAIRTNPQMRAPNSLVFPLSVVERFLRVREGLLTTIRQAEEKKMRDAALRVQQQDEKRKREAELLRRLRALAGQEAVVEKNRRWLASVPFGVGQFQNRDYAAGWVFLSVEAALIGTAVTAITIDQRLANKAQLPGVDVTELSSKRQDAYHALVASTWGFGLVAAAGILHAHLRFVTEHRSVRSRALPKEVANAPQKPVGLGLSQAPNGLGLQLIASF